MKRSKLVWSVIGCVLVSGLLSSCRRHKYENPITDDTMQPDKVLFDKAIADIEKGRYGIARLTLQTLVNTYDSSEFMAKAKLAIADSWYLEGGSSALAQAEAEYKDFILFYPNMEESAEAQSRVCAIHYDQMEKPDRDPVHALRANQECKQLLVQFPNSRFAPEIEQRLRNIQEVLAEHEYRVGYFYHAKGSFAAAANRLEAVSGHYPLFSQADEALWRLGESYEKMGTRFRSKSGEAYSRIVRDYPLSPLVDDARKKLNQLEFEIPEADPVALARMKYEQANTDSAGMTGKFWGVFRKSPDVRTAAHAGTPQMEPFRPSLPMTVPAAASNLPPEPAVSVGSGSAEVSVSTIEDSSALDTQPDARRSKPAQNPQSPPAKQ
jgi:outer membrane protein assembly factor BamD